MKNYGEQWSPASSKEPVDLRGYRFIKALYIFIVPPNLNALKLNWKVYREVFVREFEELYHITVYSCAKH